MAKQRATFGKREREREKQAKQLAKQEKRHARSDEDPATDEAPVTNEAHEAALLSSLADLHAAYEAGQVSLEDFEEQRAAITQALQT
jgi:hypothetical protein